MDERRFWLLIRRALLMAVAAVIEERYDIKRLSELPFPRRPAADRLPRMPFRIYKPGGDGLPFAGWGSEPPLWGITISETWAGEQY